MELFSLSWGSAPNKAKGFLTAVFNQIGITVGRADPNNEENSIHLVESSVTESGIDTRIGYHDRGREKFSALCHRAIRMVLLARKLPHSIFGNLPSLSLSSACDLLGDTWPENPRAAKNDPSAVYFVWDSGSPIHVTHDFFNFIDGVTFVQDGPMLGGIVEGLPVQARGYGSVDFKIFKLDKVWYAPDLKKHLISVSEFAQSNPGLELTFLGSRCTIREPSKGDRLGKLVWEGVCHEKLFMIELE